MNRTPIPSFRARLLASLVAACFGAVLGASGCGKAESRSIDSETHWLMRCESDIDCSAGSCECGVCTQTCANSSDCAALGVSGVECAAASGACGAREGADETNAASSAGSVCLLSCTDNDDCSALGADAVCESRRCERPAISLVDGVGGSSSMGGSGGLGGSGGQPGTGGTGSTSAELCDGSDDIRFLWTVGGGAVDEYYGFAASQGYGFFAVDGQCRFWRGSGPGSAVTSGALSSEDAASFAGAIGYARLTELAPYVDQGGGCLDGGGSIVWTPYSAASCGCRCGAGTGGDPWLPAFLVMSDPRLEDWLTSAQPVTGPARLALIGYQDDPGERDPLAWPLSRPPADNELYPVVDTLPRLDESSGVEINDPVDLLALRAARATYALRPLANGYTPLVWMDPDTQQVVWFHMLLRDELPARVQSALEGPLF